METPHELTPIESDILDFIKSGAFYIADDIPRRADEENAILMERRASFLICSAIRTGQFAPLMGIQGDSTSAPWVFKLLEPIQTHFYSEHAGRMLFFKFNEIEFHPERARPVAQATPVTPARTEQSLKAKPYSLRLETLNAHLDLGKSGYVDIKQTPPSEMDFAQAFKLANQQLNERSLFCICKDISSRDTPQKVCSFLDCPAAPYGRLKLPTESVWAGHFLPDRNKAKYPHRDGTTETDCAENLLNRVVYFNDSAIDLSNQLFDTDRPEGRRIYYFKDAHGDVVQTAVKLFEPIYQTKLLLPCTSWVRSGCAAQETVCVPLPKGQILYNLDLFRKGKTKAVILTDSIEIACENQTACRIDDCVWTSFLPVDDYDAVDWSPLKETGAHVYVMITNHSGMGLAESYMKARDLIGYLAKKHDVEAKFIQVAVVHPARPQRVFQRMAEVVSFLEDSGSTAINDSVRILDKSEFEMMCGRAEAELGAVRLPFWVEPGSDAEETYEPQQRKTKKKKDAIKYLMRPAVLSGGLNMIYAYSGTGKTSFVLSLCGSIVSGREFLPARVWTPPTMGDEYVRKVLYFYLEHGQSVENKSFDFIYSYLPKAKERDLKKDFIIITREDLTKEGFTGSFADEAAHDKLMEIILARTEQGTRSRFPDLVVFDTYGGMIGGTEVTSDWGAICSLFQRIQKKGSAVLFVHQSDEGGAKGKDRGYKVKRDACDTVTKLWRDKAEDTLEEPIWVKVEKLTDSSVRFDYQQFQVQYDQDKRLWRTAEKLPYEEDHDKEVEILRAKAYTSVVTGYVGSHFSRGAICEMVGYEKTQYSSLRKQYQKIVDDWEASEKVRLEALARSNNAGHSDTP
jgi:hypothetical protein